MDVSNDLEIKPNTAVYAVFMSQRGKKGEKGKKVMRALPACRTQGIMKKSSVSQS